MSPTALLSATKAARWLASSLNDTQSPLRTFGVLFPVVVMQGRLFEAYLDGERIAVNEIDKGQVYWSNPASERAVLVDVPHRPRNARVRPAVPRNR